MKTMRTGLNLLLGAAFVAALAGCSTIKNTTATAVDISSVFTGYGASTTVRGGLSEVGNFDGIKPKIVTTTDPVIFGGRESYHDYLTTKNLMARTEGDQNFTGLFPRKDNGTALLKGKQTIMNAKTAGWIKNAWHLPWTPPPYTGSTEIRIKHEGDGMTYAQVLEKGNDVEFLLAGRPDAPKRFKQEVFYTTFYAINSKGVIFGETWANEFNGGLKPINLFLGRTTVGMSDEGLMDQIQGIITRRQMNNIQYLTAAYQGKRFCGVEPNSTFCRMTVDDQNVIAPAIFGDFAKNKPTLAGLEPQIIDAINSRTGDQAGKPAKKELSW